LEFLAQQINDGSKTRWISILENIDQLVQNKLSLLRDNYGEQNLTEEFCLFWINKFETSLKEVQEAYKVLDPDYEKGLFQTRGDSIGSIAYYDENYHLVNTPLTTEDLSSLFYPNFYPGVIDSKLNLEQKRQILDFTSKTTWLHRHNLKHIRKNRDIQFLSQYPHGENLVCDEGYYLSIGQIKTDLLGKIGTVLDKLNRVFLYQKFVGNDTNNQVVSKFVYTCVNENIQQSLTRLKDVLDGVQFNTPSNASLAS